MNTPIYRKFFRRLCTKCEINPNTILISKVIRGIPCRLLNQVIDNDIYYKDKEYLKSYYTIRRIKPKLQKQLMLFNRYAHIYPNYSLLPEAKFFYWNINHKQMIINQYEQWENDKQKHTKTKALKVFRRKDNSNNHINKTTFFDCSVLKQVYNTSIFNEVFYNDKKRDANINTDDDDVGLLTLISEIEKIEKKQMTKRDSNSIKPKQEINLSGFPINSQKKYIHSQFKANRHYWYPYPSASVANNYSTLIVQTQKSKMAQINIKLNSNNKSHLTLHSSFNNPSQRQSLYFNKAFVEIKNSNHPPSLRKAILTNQSISSHSFRRKKQINLNAKLIRTIPLMTSSSKSPRFITSNNSVCRYQRTGINHPTANTSRTATIPSLTETLKLKVPLTNLKLNSKVLSRIKLKIEKQKGL